MKKITIILLTIIAQQGFSQTDKMFIGDVNDLGKEKSKKGSLKTVEKVLFSDSWIVYGKYIGVDWDTGDINFIGNDGKLYSSPEHVQYIKNFKGEYHLQNVVLKTLRMKKRALYEKLLVEQCDSNKNLRAMVIPFKNDLYGITEGVEEFLVEGCYQLVKNELGLEYLHNNELEINDYALNEISKNLNIDYIFYGFIDSYDIPFTYASTAPNAGIQTVSINKTSLDWSTALLISVVNNMVVESEQRKRKIAVLTAGSYVSCTYFSINAKTGDKRYLMRNKTIMKKGG
ncbi:MAG: hypothetical protein H8E71_00885 [Candidatus Marinimicrobia bacterium]|nr:hypothetical protein [Candidatus Neomarinimicrobiota bacterium]